MDTLDKPASGFDAQLHFRAPADLLPRIHAHARSRGLTSASWVRSLIFDALNRASATPDHQEAA